MSSYHNKRKLSIPVHVPEQKEQPMKRKAPPKPSAIPVYVGQESSYSAAKKKKRTKAMSGKVKR